MKPLTKILQASAAMFACVIAYADDQKTVDPFSVNAPVVEIPPNPNHLQPIEAYDPEGYNQAVFASLLGNEMGEIWMIARPSFSQEHAVILRHEVTYASGNNSADPFVIREIESEKWVVESVVVKTKIWQWKKLGGDVMRLDIKPTKEVKRSRVDIPSDLAETVINAWRSVLRETRYSQEDYLGCDGVTFQFYAKHNFFGETWSPSSGRPLQIVNLGYKLKELAEAEVENRPSLVLECVTLAKQLAPSNSLEDGEGMPKK